MVSNRQVIDVIEIIDCHLLCFVIEMQSEILIPRLCMIGTPCTGVPHIDLGHVT